MKLSHRSRELDALINKNVEVVFRDGRTLTGRMIFIEDFSATYGFRKPFYYCIGNYLFRKSHIKKIREV